MLRLRETHNALQLPAFFFLFFCRPYRNIGKCGAKDYFTDHRKANTLLLLLLFIYLTLTKNRKNCIKIFT